MSQFWWVVVFLCLVAVTIAIIKTRKKKKAIAQAMAGITFEFEVGDAITEFSERPYNKALFKKYVQMLEVEREEFCFVVRDVRASQSSDSYAPHVNQEITISRCIWDVREYLTHKGWSTDERAERIWLPGWIFI